jgi:hypothetical protein
MTDTLIQPDHTKLPVNCFGIPGTYRGWTITQGPCDQFYGTGPNYDASYEGPEDGWVDNGERVSAPTWSDLRDEIDAFLAERDQ